MKGTVIRNTGAWYEVRPDDRSMPDVRCKVKGNFRIKGLRTTSPVAVGDHVEVSMLDGDTGFITAICDRRNYIVRRASNLSKESHILAANIDMAILVATLREPSTPTTFIDRFLATAEAYNVRSMLVLNKADMWDPEDSELAQAIRYLYESIGYTVMTVSAITGYGVQELLSMCRDKTSLLAGNSGVGKSSLINAMVPGLSLRTGSVSVLHHTGMHTTTFSEMYDLPGGGGIIDIPGVKGFGTVHFDVREVSHFFPEIFALGRACRYADCSHTHEPGCAVMEALEQNRIARSRYASYLSILEEATDNDKYRK